MPESLPPEERLLRHIRKKRSLPNKAVSSSNDKKEDASSTISSIFSAKKSFNISNILNKTFLFFACIFIGFICYDLVFSRKDINRIITSTKAEKNQKILAITFSEPKPFNHYAKEINKRDIFEYLLRKKYKSGGESSGIPEITKNLRLVGIVLDENSEAIIHDLEAKQTFFLHVGDEIRDAVIEEISESKVIINFDDTLIELTQ